MGYLFDLTQNAAVNAPAEVLWVGRNIRWLGTKDAGWKKWRCGLKAPSAENFFNAA